MIISCFLNIFMDTLPEGQSDENLDEKFSKVVTEMVDKDERYRKLESALKDEVIGLAREIVAMPALMVLDRAINVQNVARLNQRSGADPVGLMIFNRFDRFHCRLIEGGMSVEQADRIALSHMRCLVAEGQSRLRMAKRLGYGRHVAIAEGDSDFLAATELCKRAVRNCLGLAEENAGDI
jgi:hypothetical protein